MVETTLSYSQIISPEDYNYIMTHEHLYINAADRYIVKKIRDLSFPACEVVELGCGPGRLLIATGKIQDINLTAIEMDLDFINYAKNNLGMQGISFVKQDIETYNHHKRVDIYYSQGFHHHIAKGNKTNNYLRNINNNLNKDGYYILSDEFIPNYKDQEDREVKIVIWYSHIIARAFKRGYLYLAQEEAKTLLDDLFEGRTSLNIKSKNQVDLVLLRAEAINNAAEKQNMYRAEKLAQDFINELDIYKNSNLQKDVTMDLSRGDYKICDAVFRQEVGNANFKIDMVKSFGPIESIGALSIYILKKISS